MVALEENDFMPTLHERAQERPIRGRVAVGPRRPERESQEHVAETHDAASIAGEEHATKIESTSCARWAYVCCASTRARAAAPIDRARTGSRSRTRDATSSAFFAT